MRIWPARIPESGDEYRGALAPYTYDLMEKGQPVGTSTDPARFSDADLDERARSYCLVGFALQLMLNTALDDSLRFPLKLSNLVTMPLDLQMVPVSVA